MGGYGSTRWLWHIPKRTVEQSVTLSMSDIQRLSVRIDEKDYGLLSWRFGRSKGIVAFVMYALAGADLTLCAAVGRQAFSQEIKLQYTIPNYGGKRWWFTCPFCRRRVGKLHSPPGRDSAKFACRHCHDLTYISCQESHKYDRMFSMIAAEMGKPGAGRQIERDLKERWKS